MFSTLEEENGDEIRRQRQLLGKEIVENAADLGFVETFARSLYLPKRGFQWLARWIIGRFLQAMADSVEQRDYIVVPHGREDIRGIFTANWEEKPSPPLSHEK